MEETNTKMPTENLTAIATDSRLRHSTPSLWPRGGNGNSFLETEHSESTKNLSLTEDSKTGSVVLLQAMAAFRPNISALRLHALIKYSGGIEQAWNTPDETLEQYKWNPEQRHLFNEFRKNYQPEKSYERLQNQEINFIPFSSPDFPSILNSIYDPPLGLYVRGQLQKNLLTISFVGSRRATPYGKTVTNMLVRPLAAKGAIIISGLAYGIDAEAHQATLAAHGTTWAVIGNGCDEPTLYPRSHRQLSRDIINGGGAIISEYPPGTRPQPYFFPQRNRIIAGLSRAIVVVEASIQSGALITARLGLEQNRDVFAVPGPITSEMSQGANELIRDGAVPVQSAEQIIEALELFSMVGEPRKRRGAPLRAPAPTTETGNIFNSQNLAANPTDNGSIKPQTDQEKILFILSQNPLPIDEIVKASTLPSHTVSSALTIMEIDDLIKDVGGRNYVRL